MLINFRYIANSYSNSEEVLDYLLAGDTPTTHPNKGEKSRKFRFCKTADEITDDMRRSTDPDILKKCTVTAEEERL